MDREAVILALGALSQGTRFAVVELLAAHSPHGVPAGEIARRLGVPHNTMSTHLSILAQAGLVRSERMSRIVTYRIVPTQIGAMLSTLREVFKSELGNEPS